MPAQKSTKSRTKKEAITAKKYYQQVTRRVTSDMGLPLPSGIQRWDFRLTDELFKSPDAMTVGEFKHHILNLIETEKTPGTK